MSKYSYEEKLEAVIRVVDGGMSRQSSAKILGVDRAHLKRWIDLYRIHGPDSLRNGGASYSGEFKINVVEYMHSNQLSYRSAAAFFGVKNPTHVANWERAYYEEGPEGLLKKKPRGCPVKSMPKNKNNELNEQTKEELIAEVQRLRMENEYLKKMRALVQERIDRENGKEPPSSKS